MSGGGLGWVEVVLVGWRNVRVGGGELGWEEGFGGWRVQHLL